MGISEDRIEINETICSYLVVGMWRGTQRWRACFGAGTLVTTFICAHCLFVDLLRVYPLEAIIKDGYL